MRERRGVDEPARDLVEDVLPIERVVRVEVGGGVELEDYRPIIRRKQLDDDQICTKRLGRSHGEATLGSGWLGHAHSRRWIVGAPPARRLPSNTTNELALADEQPHVGAVTRAEQFLNERALATKPVLTAEPLETLLK